MSPPSVECFFDCSSPWTWLAFHRLCALQAEGTLRVDWRPILVGVVFNEVNPSVYESRERPVPAKAAWLAKDLADCARLAGLRIRWLPSVFPVNSAAAMRGCLYAAGQGVLEDFAARVFRAYWSDDEDISDRAVLARIAVDAGLSAEGFAEAVDGEAARAALRANTAELIDRGGFGSPTMFAGGGDMYFGNDRIDNLLAALRAAT